ncbi:Plasmid Partition par B protein [Xenorhabdus bovienii str. puntauvense]|uniref:Plasmid Partition par B protein n=1 Tax=Xenorhabdus bovienii str. puntauvense TaxID=1398201 RepID=A0A077NET9_XENBV|nr:ParB family protein [Xenorhabdus bovienii]CDG96842.1 Plasmid Partition par B protein [Xenorhabdus bovienii str. puntauvense]
MQNKRKTIGRILSTESLPESSKVKGTEQRFTLSSGKTAVFHQEHIPADRLEAQTIVQFSVNGRDQSALTEESLSDIIRTIKLQQFFPAIGRKVGDKIEILDGSRRRAAALYCKIGLNILVTNTDISSEDARQLAADIQTAKEHNIREIGLRLIQLRDGGMTQKEIAASQKISPAKVTRAIQCASVSNDMVAIFPIQSELSYPDYKLLLDIDVFIKSNNLSINDVVNDVREGVAQMGNSDQIAADEMKNLILKFFKQITSKLATKNDSTKAQISPIWEFKEKDVFARKRVKDRSISYEFNRVPKAFQEELERMIQVVLRKHFNE